MTFTPLEKGYYCPNMEDCSKCHYHDTLCIVYGKEGKKKLRELEEDYKRRNENARRRKTERNKN